MDNAEETGIYRDLQLPKLSGEKQQNWDFPGGPEIKNLPCGDRKEGRREREGHSERQRKKKGGRQGKRERDTYLERSASILSDKEHSPSETRQSTHLGRIFSWKVKC